jgi:hypothetical protein
MGNSPSTTMMTGQLLVKQMNDEDKYEDLTVTRNSIHDDEGTTNSAQKPSEIG